MQQMQPYTRGDTLPVPYPQQREPLAERNGHYGHADNQGSNGWANGATATAHLPQPNPQLPIPAAQPTYLEVLFQQIQQRWRLLAGWMFITAGVAALAVMSYGRPMWKAEGTLFYSPNFSLSHKRLYTPPNIQTILRLVRSPEILEKVRKEKNIPVSTEAMQSKLTVTVVNQSDLISVAFEWPNKDQAEEVAQRILELAIEQYENLRRKLSGQAITDLEDSLKKSSEDERTMKLKLQEMLDGKKIFDLKVAKDNIGAEASRLRTAIEDANREKTKLENDIATLDKKIKEGQTKSEGMEEPQSEGQRSLLRQKNDILEKWNERHLTLDTAKIKLKSNQEKEKSLRPLYEQRQIPRDEWLTLQAEIATQKRTIEISKEIMEKMEKEMKEIDEQIKKGSGSALVNQARIERQSAQVALASIPNRIADLEKLRDEKLVEQQYILGVEKEAMPILQDIEGLQQARISMTQQKQDHQKLEANKLNELTIYSSPSTGGAPSSSNYAKLGLGVFALSLLLFVGFIAYFDMPTLMAKPAPTVTPLPAPAMPPALPASQLPVPVWQHDLAPATVPLRSPSMNNEHLRALAERIAQGAPERGSVILFTPTTDKLRVEALLGDLGCFCLEKGGKVLVFEARTEAEGPMYPAWTGPSAREVGESLEDYLEGRSDRAEPCFAETLLTSIDYARGDLSRQLSSVMSMYRFRQLLHEIKDRYALVLMIAPERNATSEIDVFTTLAEGIVVVINQDADPADVEAYLRQLRACETPVFGAVTVPPG